MATGLHHFEQKDLITFSTFSPPLVAVFPRVVVEPSKNPVRTLADGLFILQVFDKGVSYRVNRKQRWKLLEDLE